RLGRAGGTGWPVEHAPEFPGYDGGVVQSALQQPGEPGAGTGNPKPHGGAGDASPRPSGLAGCGALPVRPRPKRDFDGRIRSGRVAGPGGPGGSLWRRGLAAPGVVSAAGAACRTALPDGRADRSRRGPGGVAGTAAARVTTFVQQGVVDLPLDERRE